MSISIYVSFPFTPSLFPFVQFAMWPCKSCPSGLIGTPDMTRYDVGVSQYLMCAVLDACVPGMCAVLDTCERCV